MNILQVALAIEKWAAKQAPITVQRERCLNTKRKGACSACALACPTDAIRLEGGVQLQPEMCIQCGLCLHACPTGVFSGDDEAYRLLYCVAQLVDHESVELACKFHPSAAQGSQRVDAVLTTTRCLSALNVPTYAALFGMGVHKVIVRLDACANCTLAPLSKSIEQTVANAQRLVPDGKRSLVVEKDAAPRRTKTRPIYAINNPPLSRRAVFKRFLGATPSENVLTAFKDAAESEASPIPLERRQMLEALRALPHLRSDTQLPEQSFTNLAVSSACTACGVCSRVCPTNALRARQEAATFALEFTAAHCINCGNCIDLCHEQAVSRAGTPTLDEVRQEQVTTLYTGTLRHCPKCRAPYTGGGEFCPICTYRSQNLFGDKLRRG